MEDKNRFSFISTQGFAERLRRRRLGLGLRKRDLAAQVGVSLTTIQQYENGQLPKGEFAVRLGAALRCSLDWLLAGQGNVEGALQDQWAGLVMVPMVEARLPAGTGSFETSGDVVRHYAFREDFLRRKGSPSHMALLRVSGDSMEPRICHNDVVLVDQSQKDPVPGRIYAVSVEDSGLPQGGQRHAGAPDPQQLQSCLSAHRGLHHRPAGRPGAHRGAGGLGGA